MPLSQDLKFFKKILKLTLKNDGENVNKIKIHEHNSFIRISIICDNKVATFDIYKSNIEAIIINYTKEDKSLNYLVKNIEWRITPL